MKIGLVGKIYGKINASPRVKTFVWLLCHNKIKTYTFLHAMNLSLIQNCVFYDLQVETAEQLINHCTKVQLVWTKIVDFLVLVFMVLTLLLQVLGWITLMPTLLNICLPLSPQHAGTSGNVDVIGSSKIEAQISLLLLKPLWIMLKISLFVQHVIKDCISFMLISLKLDNYIFMLLVAGCWRSNSGKPRLGFIALDSNDVAICAAIAHKFVSS